MLNKEQQEIIENSLWVVNAVLEAQKLQNDEDMRQIACLYLCKCIERFNPEYNVKWTTYAYKSVFLYIRRVYARQKKRENKIIVDEEVYKTVRSPRDLEGEVHTQILLTEIKSTCSEKEKEILKLLGEGYLQYEIAEMLQISRKEIHLFLERIRNNFKK